MNTLRKLLAIGSIIIGGTAVAIPDLVWAKALMAFATSLNAASLYLMREEKPNGNKGPTLDSDPSA